MRTEPLDPDVAGARRTRTGRRGPVSAPGSEPWGEPPSPTTRVFRSFAFIDLCGFTDFVDVHGDDAAVAELRILRACVREAAGAAGVRVDKWLGDGVMLVGVEPEPLVTAVIALEAHHEARGQLPLRAGIATGAVILLDGDDYVGRAVRACQPFGTTPSCWRKPSVSQTCQVSAILPSWTRWMLIASTFTLLPVGAMPFMSPTWVPLPVQRATTRSPVEKISSICQWPSTPCW